MSDKTMLVSVEDLIYGAFGSFDGNTVNFRVLHSVLRIFALHLRMLQQDVEIGFDGRRVDKTRRIGADQDQVDDIEEYNTGATPAGMVQGSHGKALTDGARKDGKPDGARKDGVPEGARKDGASDGAWKDGAPEGARKDGAPEGAGGSGRSDGVSGGRVGGIQGVTVSQFALLEEAVRKLADAAGPLPTPTLPDDLHLRNDLAKGRASLSQTMSAMQLKPRVEAAERGLTRLAELLTQLAALGVLPPGVAANVKKMRSDLLSAAMKTRAQEGPDVLHAPEWLRGAKEPSQVTREQMEDLIKSTKDEICKEIEKWSTLVNDSALMAFDITKTISDKMEIALKINHRIGTLFSLTDDYVLQLNGFDFGFMSQLMSFREQMVILKCDLTGGHKLFDTVSKSTETVALIELNERYQPTAEELKTVLKQHKALDMKHTELCIEVKNLIECLELLREDKVDREEVTDGLRDKANLADLIEMLQETDFAKACVKLEEKIAKSYDQFKKMESVWQNVLKELMVTMQWKAEVQGLIGLKVYTKERLFKLQEDMRKLEVMLGEPKAAVLVRKVKMDGVCLTEAINEPKDRTSRMTRPVRVPPAEPCLADVASSLTTPNPREHTCLRWVGGSHTLLPNTVPREKANLIDLQLAPTRKFAGYGDDGKLYLMEEELQPCAECNQEYHPKNISSQVPTPTGGGRDQACH